ncbi:Peptide-N4-(N-acetyl-beta-glucosaminyl)asparagineamidase A protein [Striga hermonthica]|uniref:Peptide-N4-(N-acetyl-beta-glucosaminyl)asparagine amidase A protein n=1 Tax=Striga hermonthica TaxID=68872 RepID=A0A9N7R6Y5_STRHE|nr:Peptide-N4-(N-acetyl-beta-glucosaminyl)asparagineamidase A protein [Striga hermonthica]
MDSSLLTLSLLILALLSPHLSTANLHNTSHLRSQPIPQSLSGAAVAAPPTTYFEVAKPIPLPKTKPCSYSALKHDFAYTYGKPPVLAAYKPPSDCNAGNSSKIVLEWTATSKGRQFDRIFGVWLGGVEILRSCTAEPRKNGTVWTVRKDVTRYHSLLTAEKEQTLAVYLGNIVDSTYTGVYHVNLKFHFYPSAEISDRRHNEFLSGADLILPISRNLPLNDGLWFEIENSTFLAEKELEIPRNAYRAVLEVYVSFHEKDEFWFGNFPNEYISVNNLSSDAYPGNGPFREVVVKLDDTLIGAVWPFTVIFTGGVNPLLWRPITGIGSFNLPTYDIEVTPFLGSLLDGKKHTFGFSVTNALNVWYVNANLHLWLDKKSDRTQGKLLSHVNSPLSLSIVSNYSGFDGLFTTNASRSVVSSGWVKSSHGFIKTKSRQEFEYNNGMALGNHANVQIFDQTIKLKSSVDIRKPSSNVLSAKLFRKFRTFVHSDDTIDRDNGTEVYAANVTLGFYEQSRKSSGFGSITGRLKNRQNGQGYIVIVNGSVVNGVGSTQQDYSYSDGKVCYSRNVSSSNYTILHDVERNTCRKH